MKKTWKIYEWLAAVLLIIGIILIFVTNIAHYNYKMNSDIGAEAVLGRLIWDSREIIPSSWYPSTETRIIATPQVGALFYGMTGNMDLSMGLACCVMTIVSLLSIWFFMKKVGCSRISGLLLCFLCLLLSGNMIILELLYLFAGYYAIHIIAFFYIMNCYGSLLQKEWQKSKGRQRMVYEKGMIGLLLAFLLGMQGTRGILITFGPLFGIEVIRTLYETIYYKKIYYEKVYFKKSLEGEKIQLEQFNRIPFLWATGLLIISFLGTKMPYSSGQEISRNIRNGFSKLLQTVLPDMWGAVGFSEGYPVRNICLAVLVINVVIWVVIQIVRMLKWQELNSLKWCFLVTAASPVVTALMVAFTTVESSERYYFMWIFSMAFAVILDFEHGAESLFGQKTDDWENMDLDDSRICQMLRKREQHNRTAWLTMTVITLITAGIIIGINVHTVYRTILKSEEPTASDALEVVNYLEENRYETAYSTFENANKMTALSNGKVNVYAINSFETMDICKWLTDRKGYPENGIVDQDGTVYIIPEACIGELAGRMQADGEEYQLLANIGTYEIWRMKKIKIK